MQPAPSTSLTEPVCRALHYLVTGTFNTVALYLLAFDPVARSLSITKRIEAQGPHQYFATNAAHNRLYATTWATPYTLSAWSFETDDLVHVNTVPITSCGSYLSVFEDRIYSAGGPTGEVHSIDGATGGFGSKLQELVFVESSELATVDKSRKALRYGAHSADISQQGRKAFVAHLGRNSIYMYDTKADGQLELIAEAQSAREHDAPRHCLPSKDGRFVYSVTEHTSYVDVYAVEGKTLRHLQSVSIIPDDRDRHDFRGDTLRFGHNAYADGSIPLIASTRGKTPATRGYIAAWAVDLQTGLLSATADSVIRFETATSGGKANAVEPAFWAEPGVEMIILTDDDEGYVSVLEFDGWEFTVVDSVRLPGKAADGAPEGASHAVWLS